MSDYTSTGPGKNHEGNVIDFLIARGLTGVEKVKKDGGPDGKAVEGNFEFKQNRSAKMFSIKIQWDGTNAVTDIVSSGMYVVSMRAKGMMKTQKIMFLK